MSPILLCLPLVCTTQTTSPAPQEPTIKIYQVKYATPKDLAELLGKLMDKKIEVFLGPQPKYIRDTLEGESLGAPTGPPLVRVATADGTHDAKSTSEVTDQFVRFLVLKGPAAPVAQALELLQQLDLPAPQVRIEAKILDLNEGVSSAIGISYDTAPGGKTATFKLDKPPSQGTAAEMAFGRLSRDVISFTAALDAAIQKNNARLLANPTLTVLYNQRARIFIGDEVTYLLGTQVNVNGTTLQAGKVNVGVELNVTAVGNPDGTITMKVNPEVGSLLQLVQTASGVSLPRVARRTVQTSVRLRDGETLVIGGLLGENELQAVRKVPLLGDLPVLGQLFRRDTREKSRSELVIVLKATIVGETP